ncbi:MAG: tryptophan synthase subunit alpha [Alphaproteobacteria bacterium]|nr:tryptophan synthase subunit alpha [Alphaproteobacteria bacterium]
MTRLDRIFKSLDRPALVTFTTAGDPDHDKSLALMKALPGAGADIIELGMPFTDPMADGPVIQLASQRALEAGANMRRTLEMVRAFREDNQDTPVVLMGYANPVMAYGFEAFAKDAADAGVDGTIIVDIPPEEDAELRAALSAHGLSMIRLITPTTDEKRLMKLLDGAGGFLYYVSITGVTGAASANLEALEPHIETIRKHTDLPIAIGFGIKTPEDAARMGRVGNAVVVGSSIVENFKETQDVSAVADQVRALSGALRP